MNFLKRSIVSVIRNPSRTFVVFLIVFVMGSIVSASIATEASAKQLVANVEDSLVYSAQLSINEDLYQLSPELFSENLVNQEMAKELSLQKGVVSYDYSLHANWKTPVLENNNPLLIDTSKPEFAYRLEKLPVIGTENGRISEFESETLVVIEGNMFTAESISQGDLVTMIPENIAVNNNLAVGDYLYFDNYFYQSDRLNDNQTLEVDPNSIIIDRIAVKIVGVYALASGNAGKAENLIPEYQQIYMPNTTIERISKQGMSFFNSIASFIGSENYKLNDNQQGGIDIYLEESYVYQRPTTSIINQFANESWFDYDFLNLHVGYQASQVIYLFESQQDINDFVTHVDSTYDHRLVVTSDAGVFQAILSPIRMVWMIATFTKFLALVGMVFVLSLVTQLFIQQRRYEIGVYLSIGEKRWKVVAQMFLETVIVAFIALLLTTQAGIWLASKTSTSMISSQLSEYRVIQWVDSSGSAPDAIVSKVEDKFMITMTSEYFVEYIIVGTMVVAISSILPIIIVMRLKPKEVML